MAAPSVPTATTITTEALKRCGYSTPSAAQLSRAADWLEEVKNDIWLLGKRLKPLMAEHLEVLTPGRSRYNFPSDFSSIHSASVWYGDEDDDVIACASTTSLTLDTTDEDEGEDELEGKSIFIYSGTGKGSFSQITSYNETTYVATLSPALVVQAIAGDTYVLVDTVTPIDFQTVQHFDRIETPHLIGQPQALYAVGDTNHYGFYELFPAPDEDSYYAIHFRYYANLLTLDLTGTRMAILYQRWRNLFTQGVKARQLEEDDDSRATSALQQYYKMVQDTVSLETYGRNIKADYTKVRA